MRNAALLLVATLAGCSDAPDADSCRAIEDRYLPRFEALGDRGMALMDRSAGDPTPAQIDEAQKLERDLRALHAQARDDLAGCTGPKRDLKGLYGDI